MSDYVVAVGFQTDAGTVKRSTDQLADSVDKVGKAQGSTARSTKDLTSASSQLERVQARIEIQQKKLAAATSAVERMQARGATTSKYYTQALETQIKAQDALAGSLIKAQRLQAGGSGAPKRGATLVETAVAAGAGYVTGQAIARLVTSSLSDFGRLNQGVAQSKQVFGEFAGQIDAFGRSSAQSIGLSRTAVLDETNDLGQLFRTMQVGQGQSATMSLALVKLSTDLGALSHADPTAVFQALKGGLTGQYDALQKYNVVLNTAVVRQEAQRLGLVQGTEQLSQAAQAQAAYSLIIAQTVDRQGAFAASTDKAYKQQQQLAASLANAKLELGRGLTPALIELEHIASHTLIPALKLTGEAIGFIGGHATTRRITELVLILYGTTKAVDLLAAAWGRVTVAAGTAATAEAAAGAAGVAGAGAGAAAAGGGAGAGLLGGAARFLIANPLIGVTLGALLYGIKEVLDDKHKQGVIRDEVAVARAGGTQAMIALADKYGVSSLNGSPNQFIVDPKADPDRVKAAEQLLQVAEQQLAAAKELRDLLRDLGPLTVAQRAAMERSVAAANAVTGATRSASLARQFVLDPRALAASSAGQPLPGLTSELPNANVDLTALRQDLRSANQALALAQGRSSGRAATPAQIASAEASVASARAAARKPGGDFEAEQARLRAAEARLAELRRGGSRDARSAAQAEKGLEDARERVRKANKALADGEEAVHGLSAKTVLGRFDSSKKRSEEEVRNVRKLVAAGVAAPVIEDLKKLETTAPGTLANVAKALTPAFVAQLNHDAAARRKAADALALLGGQASVNDTEARLKILGQRAGLAYHAGWLLGLNGVGLRQGLPLDDTRPPPAPPKPPASPGVGAPKTNAIPRDDVRSVSLRTSGVSNPVVHLSPESVAAVGNHVRAGTATTSTHTNVFPNVSNFGAAIDEAERRDRRSRIIGG